MAPAVHEVGTQVAPKGKQEALKETAPPGAGKAFGPLVFCGGQMRSGSNLLNLDVPEGVTKEGGSEIVTETGGDDAAV